MAGGTQQGLEIKVLSGSHCPCMAQQTPIYPTFALPSSCNFFCSPFKYQTLSLFTSEMPYKPQLPKLFWCLIFLMKTRLGMKETNAVEVSNPDGSMSNAPQIIQLVGKLDDDSEDKDSDTSEADTDI